MFSILTGKTNESESPGNLLFSFASSLLKSFCTAMSSNRIYWVWKTFLVFMNGKGKEVLAVFKAFGLFLKKETLFEKKAKLQGFPKLSLLMQKSESNC